MNDKNKKKDDKDKKKTKKTAKPKEVLSIQGGPRQDLKNAATSFAFIAPITAGPAIANTTNNTISVTIQPTNTSAATGFVAMVIDHGPGGAAGQPANFPPPSGVTQLTVSVSVPGVIVTGLPVQQGQTNKTVRVQALSGGSNPTEIDVGDQDCWAYYPGATVTGVSSTTNNGTYYTGQTINVTVQFSAAVTVTGVPTLTLATAGVANQAVNYANGSPGQTLVFAYTVQSGDMAVSLDYLSSLALALNGGTILSGGVAANLTLPNPGSMGSLTDNKSFFIDTPVLRYMFNEQAGNNVSDSTANACAATWQVNNSWSASAPYAPCLGLNGSVSFNGQNGSPYILETNPDVDTNLSQNFTIACWIYAGSFGSNMGAVSRMRSANGQFSGYALCTDGSGKLALLCQQMVNGAVSYTWYSVSSNPSTSTWHHIAVGMNSGTAFMYIDGTSANLTPSGSALNTTPGTDGQPTTRVAIGRIYSDQDNYYFNGNVADIHIFDRPIAQSDVDILMCN